MADPTPSAQAAALRLTQVAQTAYDLFPNDCSHSVQFVLQQLVSPNQPYRVANDLMAAVAKPGSGWRSVTMQEASDLANRGKVVVGGLVEAGHGHVLIVMPGDWHAAGGFEANGRVIAKSGTYPPSMSGSLGRWPGAHSRGEKTVRDPWAARDWPNVTFWTRQ